MLPFCLGVHQSRPTVTQYTSRHPHVLTFVWLGVKIFPAKCKINLELNQILIDSFVCQSSQLKLQHAPHAASNYNKIICFGICERVWRSCRNFGVFNTRFVCVLLLHYHNTRRSFASWYVRRTASAANSICMHTNIYIHYSVTLDATRTCNCSRWLCVFTNMDDVHSVAAFVRSHEKCLTYSRQYAYSEIPFISI